jgi:hypothetical protein
LSSLVALVVLVHASAAGAQEPVLIGAEPFLIAGGPYSQVDSPVSGTIVAFTNQDSISSRVYYVDLAVPGAVPQAIPGEIFERDSQASVSGHIIVFKRFSDATSGELTMAFDVRTPSAAPFAVSPSSVPQHAPDVGADTVALVERLGGSYNDICVSSLLDPSRAKVCLTSDHLQNNWPSVSPDGNVVVWSKCPSLGLNDCDLYVAGRDPATGAWSAPRLLADTGFTDTLAHTDGRLVTWSANGDIYYMSLDGTIPLQTVPVPGWADSTENLPQVHGKLISFQRRFPLGAPADVYFYDVETGTLYLLNETPAASDILINFSVDEVTGQVWVAWTIQDVAPGSDWDVWGATFTLGRASYVVQPLFNQARAYKLGSVVPIRLQLLAADGTNLSSASLVLTATALVQKDGTADPLVVEDAGNANPDSAFRYDAALDGYVFNLATKALSPGTWELRFVTSGDAREYRVRFDLR